MKTKALVPIALLLALALLPGAAGAADTYVAPNGSGNACTQASPCSILTGGNEADADSAIILAPGDYGSAVDPIDDRIYTFAPNANYVGRNDVRLFVDASSSTASVTIYSGQKFLGYGTRIISFDEVGVGIYGSARAERIDVRTSIDGSTACRFGNEGMETGGQLTNSLCVADGFGSKGIELAATRNEESAMVMGSTGVSVGNGGAGITASNSGITGGGTGFSRLNVFLSIARAEKGYDLDGGFDSDDNEACISARHTSALSLRPNICGIAEDNPIRELPGFIDPVSDFHLAPGSPLIDAVKNFSYPIPSVDLEGNPRDATDPDPGAYEFLKPAPPRRCVVPRLRGLKMPQVRNRLRNSNCALGRVTRKKVAAKRKAGRVLRQSPRAGLTLNEGARVRVTVGRKARSRR